jgi:hypothetical protein
VDGPASRQLPTAGQGAVARLTARSLTWPTLPEGEPAASPAGPPAPGGRGTEPASGVPPPKTLRPPAPNRTRQPPQPPGFARGFPPAPPFLALSRPSPGVIAAAGHRTVRNTTPAQTDNPGAAHRHAIETSAQIPPPLAASPQKLAWMAGTRRTGRPTPGSRRRTCSQWSRSVRPAWLAHHYGWPYAGTLAVVLELRAACLKTEDRRFKPP